MKLTADTEKKRQRLLKRAQALTGMDEEELTAHQEAIKKGKGDDEFQRLISRLEELIEQRQSVDTRYQHLKRCVKAVRSALQMSDGYNSLAAPVKVAIDRLFAAIEE